MCSVRMNPSGRPLRSRPGRLGAGTLLALGAVVSLTACGRTDVLDLELGQCLTDATGEGQVSSVEVVDCGRPHVGEVYALPRLPDGEYPGEQAVQERAQQLCGGQEFHSYVGVAYERSEIYFSTLAPSSDTWSGGDREIVCILANQDSSPITGSLRGANR